MTIFLPIINISLRKNLTLSCPPRGEAPQGVSSPFRSPAPPESVAITATHFDDHIKDNGFGWVTVAWELSLVTGCDDYVTDCLILWLREIHRRWPEPDAIVPLLGEFGEAWRRDFPDNSRLNYHFIQRGTDIEGAISEPMVIDFTRYDITATEPPIQQLTVPCATGV